MKLPSFISDTHDEVAKPINSRSLRSTLRKTYVSLLLLATIYIIFFLCVFMGVLVFTTRQENPSPGPIVFALLLLMPASLQPMFMISYANRIQEFREQSNPENLWSVLNAQRKLWTLTGFFALLGFLFVVMGLVSQKIGQLG